MFLASLSQKWLTSCVLIFGSLIIVRMANTFVLVPVPYLGLGVCFCFSPPFFFLDWVYLCSHGSPGTLCVGQADLGFTNTGTKMCATMYSSCYFYYSGSVIYFRIWNGDSLPSIFLFAQIVLAV